MNRNRWQSNRRRAAWMYRDPMRGILLGVCAGLAERLGVGTLLLRALTVLCFLFHPLLTIAGYVLLGLLLPRAPAWWRIS